MLKVSDNSNRKIKNLPGSHFLKLLILSLIFSTITSLNLNSNPKVDQLIYDNQYYATLAMNLALGRGFCYTKVGDCAWETLTPEEFSKEVVNSRGDCIPTNMRAPLGPIVLGFFLKLTDYDLLRAIVWYNFIGLWILGFYLSRIMMCHFHKIFPAVLILILHFILLPIGYTTLYPTLVVNVWLLLTVYYGAKWLEDRIDTKNIINLAVSGSAMSLLILTRPHFIIYLCIMPIFMFHALNFSWPNFLKKVAIFFLPILLLNSLWIVRNAIVLKDWSHTNRGIENFYFRTYQDGDGSYFLINGKNLISQLEGILGPLPERIKENVSFANEECKPDRHPEVIFIPKDLRWYVLKAAFLQIIRNPGNYLAASMRRLEGFWKSPYPPLYDVKRPLLQNNKLQRSIINPLIYAVLVVIFFPLKWYNILFIIAVGLAISRTRYASSYLSLSVVATLSNIFLLATTSVAAPSYSAFTWSATLVAITWSYYFMVKNLYDFGARNLVKVKGKK